MTPLLPLQPEILTSLLSHFQRATQITSLLVGLFFMARLSLLVISVSSPSSYGELFKDTIQYFLLITLFPPVFRIANEITGALAYRLFWEPPAHDPDIFDKIFETLKQMSPLTGFAMSLTPVLIGHLAQAISTLMIALLVAIGPVVILLNTMLDFHKGVATYFASLLSFCLWPVLWNLLGSLANELVPHFSGSSFLKVVFWACVMLLQLISPWISVFLFTSLSPGRAVTGIINRASRHVGRL